MPCELHSECSSWDDGTFCEEGTQNIYHTNKSCMCAVRNRRNGSTGECNGMIFMVSRSQYLLWVSTVLGNYLKDMTTFKSQFTVVRLNGEHG